MLVCLSCTILSLFMFRFDFCCLTLWYSMLRFVSLLELFVLVSCFEVVL